MITGYNFSEPVKNVNEVSMSTFLPTLVALALAAHGVGHMLFLVTLLGLADWGQVEESWLITPRFGCYVTQAIGGIVWLAATILFLGAAFAIFVGSSWWPEAAVYGALASILGLFLFWNKKPSQPVISALLFDLAVLAAVWVFGITDLAALAA